MDAYQADFGAILAGAYKAGVINIITIGIDLESSEKAVKLATQHPGIYATVGIHPHSASDASVEGYNRLRQLASSPQVVGFGEIGLDYAKEYSPKEVQLQEFAAQLAIAKELDLPPVIHDRDAHEDTLHMLKEYAPFPQGGVLHCFSGDTGFAKEVIKLGFYISIPGIVTFKNAETLHKVVQETELEHMLVESDGPFLAPVPYRGKRNLPEYVVFTASKIAEIKNCSFTKVAEAATRNTRNLFHLDPDYRLQ